MRPAGMTRPPLLAFASLADLPRISRPPQVSDSGSSLHRVAHAPAFPGLAVVTFNLVDFPVGHRRGMSNACETSPASFSTTVLRFHAVVVPGLWRGEQREGRNPSVSCANLGTVQRYSRLHHSFGRCWHPSRRRRALLWLSRRSLSLRTSSHPRGDVDAFRSSRVGFRGIL